MWGWGCFVESVFTLKHMVHEIKHLGYEIKQPQWNMDRVQVFEANYRTSHYLINLADSSYFPSERSQNKLADFKTAAI